MKHHTLWLLFALACAGCSGASFKAGREPGRKIGSGLVVEHALAGPDVQEKVGLQAISDRGGSLFSADGLLWRGGGTSTYIAGTLPKTVRVTWRADVELGKYKTTGRVIGDYLVEVDKRVPDDVIRYANAGPGRSLRLIFRIKDDGVLFGWDVEESVRHPAGGRGLVNSMRGGDVPCNDLPRAANAPPDCTAGPLEAASWFNPKWLRGRSLL